MVIVIKTINVSVMTCHLSGTTRERWSHGKQRLKSRVLRWLWKMASGGADVTCCGRLFQVRGPATGRSRSPTVDSRNRLVVDNHPCTSYVFCYCWRTTCSITSWSCRKLCVSVAGCHWRQRNYIFLDLCILVLGFRVSAVLVWLSVWGWARKQLQH